MGKQSERLLQEMSASASPQGPNQRDRIGLLAGGSGSSLNQAVPSNARPVTVFEPDSR